VKGSRINDLLHKLFASGTHPLFSLHLVSERSTVSDHYRDTFLTYGCQELCSLLDVSERFVYEAVGEARAMEGAAQNPIDNLKAQYHYRIKRLHDTGWVGTRSQFEPFIRI
jgi:hypothetical protein